MSSDPDPSEALSEAPSASASPRQPGGARVILGAMLGVVGMLGVVFFVTTLVESGQATGAVVRAYAAEARAGQGPKPLRADADTEATTSLLARSADLSVRNFTVSSGDGSAHACVWTRVDRRGGGGDDVDFFLEKQGESWKVVSLSATRHCTCPEGTDPCAMP